ncbi:MAG: hypothetical protein NTAFB01_16530 [Nitrospira sp.]
MSGAFEPDQLLARSPNGLEVGSGKGGRYLLIIASAANGVEFGIAHVKGIVMRLKRIIFIKIERQPVVHTYWSEMPGRTLILQPKDIRKETSRLSLVTRRHDRMIQFDGHDASQAKQGHKGESQQSNVLFEVYGRRTGLTGDSFRFNP